MNEDEVVEGCIPSAEVGFLGNSSEDSIPDAKYYLVRPKDSSMIYVMEDKPDYKKEPFYARCAGCKSDMQDYLMGNCLCELDLEEIDCDVDNYLYALDLHPSDNTVVCIFGEPAKDKVDVFQTLTSIDTYSADKEVARYYKTFDWHILVLLNNEPFKSYIQEHLDEFKKIGESKAPSTLGPTKESKGTPVILNRRLLI